MPKTVVRLKCDNRSENILMPYISKVQVHMPLNCSGNLSSIHTKPNASFDSQNLFLL